MKRLLGFGFLLSLFFGACDQKNYASDINGCVSFDSAEAEMVRVRKAILAKYPQSAQNRKFLKAFNDAQVKFLQYRKAHIDELYPFDDNFYKEEEDWKTYTNCMCNEMVLLTKQRTKLLRIWLDGSRERTDCASSLNMNP